MHHSPQRSILTRGALPPDVVGVLTFDIGAIFSSVLPRVVGLPDKRLGDRRIPATQEGLSVTDTLSAPNLTFEFKGFTLKSVKCGCLEPSGVVITDYSAARPCSYGGIFEPKLREDPSGYPFKRNYFPTMGRTGI